MPLPRILRLCAFPGRTIPIQYHILPFNVMKLPESETFSTASISTSASAGPVLAFGAASGALHPGAGVVACAASSDASTPVSDASAAPSFSGSAAASEGGWLTPEQMAQKLNVSRRCLGNWARDRIIPMIKIGRVCRFDLPQVMAALKQHEQGTAKR